MFELKDIKENVGKIVIANDKIFISQNDRIISNDKILAEFVEPTTFWVNDYNQLVYYDKNGKGFLVDKKGKIQLNERFFISTIHNNIAVGKNNWKRENKQFNWELGIYDLFTSNYRVTSKHKNYKIEDTLDIGYLATKKPGTIILFDKKTLDIIWEANLEIELKTGGHTKHINYFGETTDKLVFSDTKHSVFVLDRSSGKLIAKFREVSGINKNTQTENLITKAESFVLDKKKEELISVFGVNYIKIDLKNNSISFQKVSDIMLKNDIIFFQHMNQNPFTVKHLFTTTIKKMIINDEEGRYNSIVALNRNTLQIDWEYVFLKTAIGTNIPIICNNILLQKDNEGNLYEFNEI